MVELDVWGGQARCRLSEAGSPGALIITRTPARREELIARGLDPAVTALTLDEALIEVGERLGGFRVLSESLGSQRLEAFWREVEGSYEALREFAARLAEGGGGFSSWLFRTLALSREFASDPTDPFPIGLDELPEEGLRLRELADLTRAFEAQLEEEGAGDRVSALRILSRRLLDSSALFSTIVLDQMSSLTPLEGVFLEALIGCAREAIAVVDPWLCEDSARTPSRSWGGGLRRFLARVEGRIRRVELEPPHEPQRDLVAALFDGGDGRAARAAPHLSLWSCHDSREEVWRAARFVRGWRAGGREASELLIAVPDVEALRGVFGEAEERLGVRFEPVRGAPLSASPEARRVRALLSWLESGTCEAMLAWYEELEARGRAPSLSEEQLQSLCAGDIRLARLWEDISSKLKVPGFPEQHELQASRLHAAMRMAQARGGADFEADWIEPLCLAGRSWLRSNFEHPKRIAGLLFDLLTLHADWQRSRALRDEEVGLAAFSGVLREASGGEVGEHLMGALDAELAAPWMGPGARGLMAVRSWVEAQLSAHEAPTRWPAEAVPVVGWSELGELSCRAKGILILGLSQRGVSALGLRGPQSDVLREHRYEREFDGQALIMALLGQLLRGAERLILSRPRVEDNDVSPAATAWLDLERWQFSGRLELSEEGLGEVEPTLWESTLCGGELGGWGEEKARRVEAAVEVLRARSSAVLTPYDGVLGALGEEGEMNVYSPTMLEMLADCGHRHFFANMLKLPEFPELRDELPRHEVGTAVHECLELFWEDSPWDGRPIDESSFAEACEVMAGIAEGVLGSSGIDWSRGPLRRHDRLMILRGLRDGGDGGLRGHLKAALAFQRDLPFLSGPAWKTEMAFGLRGEPAVPLTERVGARGIVDRIDLQSVDGGVHMLVLDYKTGYAKTAREVEAGEALQIAIYALVAKALFPEMALLGLRGGLLTLGQPNRRRGVGDALDHPLKGVYREHLAVERQGRRWVCVDPGSAVVGERLEQARAQIAELDERVRRGALWQAVSPRACSFCDYRGICGHDEGLQARKLEVGVGELPAMSVSPGGLSSWFLEARSGHVSGGASRSLSEEQELAAEVGSSASVSAGAGSGKTYILKTRIARLIRAGVPVSAILAITFTEKAAGEIRERVEAMLGEALDSGELDGEVLDAEERRLLVRARAEMPRAGLSTIHGFCRSLLEADPLLSGVSPGQVVETGPALEELEREVLRGVFAGDSEVSGEVEALLSEGFKAGVLRRELRRRLSSGSLVSRLEVSLGRSESEWEALYPVLAGVLAEQRLRPVRGVLRGLWEGARSWSQSEDGQEVLAKRGRAAAFGMMLEELEGSFGEMGRGAWSEALSRLRSLSVEMGRANKGLGFRRGRSLPRNWWKELREALEGPCAGEERRGYELEGRGVELARAFVRVLRVAQRRYESGKRARGILDYEDLIERAHRMVAGEIPLALEGRRRVLLERLRRRFAHVLVDEFQDTDRRQWEIVRALVGGRDEERTAFFVGDPKQSVYGWRGSDNRVFERACELVSGELGGRQVVLSDNYRSGSAVLDWVNAVFEPIFHSEFDGDERLVDTAVRAQPMRAAGGHPRGSVQALWVPPGEVDEFESVARLCRRILDGEPGFELPAGSPRRIGILCRTARQLRLMGQFLDREGIAYASSHRAGFFSEPSILILETALRALVYEQDEVSLVGLLRGPLVGWTDREVYDARSAIRAAHPKLRWAQVLRDGLWDDTRGRAFAELYQGWRVVMRGSPVAALVRRLVSDSGLDLAYARLGRRGSLRNIWRFIEMIEGLGSRASAGELLSWLAHQRATASEGAALMPSADIPVVLTTIHGSKGLEFPIVVLPGLSRRPSREHDFFELELPGESEEMLGLRVASSSLEAQGERVSTLFTEVLGARQHRRVLSEEKRLFYVACTRASHHLVLPIEALKTGSFSNSTEAMWTRLRDASSHRELLLAGALPDDPEAPTTLEFRGLSRSVVIPVLSAEELL